ncbi:hypothetical protein DL763_003602 [Monosporascus cannonballus]|nr:hypothetical protein DL763_003602 [Monosporascus cannonballus]
MASNPHDANDRNLVAETVPQETRSLNPQGETDPHQHENANEHVSSFDMVSEVAETENGKSVRSSVSHWDPEPGFAHIDGDIAGNGYNETTVDIIAVPCIGASPVGTWVRDPLIDGYFEAPSPAELQRYETVKELPARAALSPAINRHLPRASQLWIRQGIRKEINAARVLLYRHRELTEGYTLDRAADDLLEHVLRMRAGRTKSRPIFFICHSIGGLVAKLALVKASREEELRSLIFDCHGMTFFYSQLSGWRASDFDEVHFSAPLVSIKSCIIGTRAEQAFSLESNHANCASFGSDNLETMHSYLAQLRQAVQKAEYLSTTFVHTPLRLGEKVKLELIGFYEDPDNDTGRDIRLYVSKHFLKEFLAKGPEQCLQERLSAVAAKPRRSPLRPSKGGTSSRGIDASGALGILTGVQEIGHRIFGHHDSPTQSPRERSNTQSPEIVVTSHPPRSQVTGTASEPPPASAPRRSRGLTVPSLSTPGFHRPSSQSSSGAGSDGVSGTASDPGESEISPRTTGDARERDAARDRDALPGINRKDHALAVKDRNEGLSNASALQEFIAGFSRPDPTRRKFMWIHLPFNNPHWVKRIFDTLSETNHQNYSKLLGNDVWGQRHVQGRHANMHASYVKPGCDFVSAESIRRRAVIKRRMAHARARPVPRDIAELESLESRVIWEYIGHDLPFNARRTLDQYGYPSLQDTYARDDDQMLYKLTKERVTPPSKNKQDMYDTGAGGEQSAAFSSASPFPRSAETPMMSEAASNKYESEEDLESDILDGNVLMVDQLWLWAIDTTTLTTFFPKRESYPTEGPMFQQADLRNSVYNELNGDLTGRCENALDLAAFVVLHAVTVLLDRTSHSDLEIFRIFEEAIGVLSERMTSSLKGFRMQTFRGKMSDESSGSDLEDNTSASIKRRHQQELEQAERENREHTSALLELRDMDDELNTMRNLFAEQHAIIETMKGRYDSPALRDLTVNGRAFLREALERLEEYKRQTKDMIDRVDTTRKDYEKLLEMVQRQAQVDEVRWSRLQTELASSQNLSVMIFTTFTVIFLPLSFFTSLFGMNTAEWGGADDNFPSLRTIGAVSLPASALLVAASLVAAFSGRAQALVRAAVRLLRRGAGGAREALSRLWPEPARRRRAARRRRLARQQAEARRLRRRERGYDFWETVRAERGSRYEIPELNRKRATQRRLAGRGTWKRMVGERW